MELFLYITSLVQRFEFLPPEGESPHLIKGSFGVTHSPESFKMRAIPRTWFLYQDYCINNHYQYYMQSVTNPHKYLPRLLKVKYSQSQFLVKIYHAFLKVNYSQSQIPVRIYHALLKLNVSVTHPCKDLPHPFKVKYSQSQMLVRIYHALLK